MLFDINNVESIHIKFSPDAGMQDVIYKGKGLEKIRRMMTLSPPYGNDPQPLLVEGYSSEEEHIKPTRGKRDKKKEVKTANGYIQTDLNYASSSTSKKSAVDLARDMKTQAAAAGFNFE